MTAVAVAISYLSVTASHSYCEAVFFTIYTPASQLFKVTINLGDLYQDEQARAERLHKQATPAWFKRLLFVCISLAATRGLTLPAVLYAVCITLVYSGLSSQLQKYNNALDNGTQLNVNYIYVTALSLSVTGDIFVNQSVGVMNLFYFILTDSSILNALKAVVDNKNIEVMEGLEQYYAEGLVQLCEVSLVFSAIIAQPCVCLLYIPVFYFCVYKTIADFRLNVKRIHSESLCLSNFERATIDSISQYDDVCAICLCAMKYARVTPCNHMFHGKCLKACLKKKAQCPMCNNQVL